MTNCSVHFAEIRPMLRQQVFFRGSSCGSNVLCCWCLGKGWCLNVISLESNKISHQIIHKLIRSLFVALLAILLLPWERRIYVWPPPLWSGLVLVQHCGCGQVQPAKYGPSYHCKSSAATCGSTSLPGRHGKFQEFPCG